YNIKIISSFVSNITLAKHQTAVKQVSEFIQHDEGSDERRYIFANLSTDHIIPSRLNMNSLLYKRCLIPQMDIIEYSSGPLKVMNYEAFEGMLKSGQVQYFIDSEPLNNFSILPDLANI